MKKERICDNSKSNKTALNQPPILTDEKRLENLNDFLAKIIVDDTLRQLETQKIEDN